MSTGLRFKLPGWLSRGAEQASAGPAVVAEAATAAERPEIIGKDVNVLVSTHTKPTYLPPPKYGPRTVVYGPHFPLHSRVNQGVQFRSTCSSHQAYDIAQLVSTLPAKQKPDVVIARIDAYFENSPVNFRDVDVPTVAILGDTHHMRMPIARMLNYLLREKFDFYVVDHNPQHAHWYMEAGIHNVAWIPAFLLADDFRAPNPASRENFAFVGSVGPIHPLRTRLIDQIEGSGIPFEKQSVPQAGAYEIYNRDRLALNYSLNGDFNLRVFEVMAAGGMLLTDRLGPAAGLDSLFEEGKDYVAYDGFDELLEKARHYLAEPGARNEIALSGHQAILERFGMDSRARYFSDLALRGKVDSGFLPPDKRIRAYGCHSRQDLMFRVGIYEWIQEQHRVTPRVKIYSDESADPRIACDAADLPRVNILQAPTDQAVALVTRAGLDGTIEIGSADSAQASTDSWDILICESDKLLNLMGNLEPSAVVLSDYLELGPGQEDLLRAMVNRVGMMAHRDVKGLYYNPKSWGNGIY